MADISISEGLFVGKNFRNKGALRQTLIKFGEQESKFDIVLQESRIIAKERVLPTSKMISKKLKLKKSCKSKSLTGQRLTKK